MTARTDVPGADPSTARTAVGLLALAVVRIGRRRVTAAIGDEPTVLTPIGGGYVTSTLAGFSRAAAEGASGPTVDLVVVPSAYGDAAKDRAENLALAQERTDQLDAACDAVVAPPPTRGCTATLAVLLNRADALDPANAVALRDPAHRRHLRAGRRPGTRDAGPRRLPRRGRRHGRRAARAPPSAARARARPSSRAR